MADQNRLQILIALDAELYGPEGLHLKSFSARWGISIRQLNREIFAFQELGHATFSERMREDDGTTRTRHFYLHGVKPVFTVNLGIDRSDPDPRIIAMCSRFVADDS